ncbi:MAG: Fur family transcriptional regulator [bacterium]
MRSSIRSATRRERSAGAEHDPSDVDVARIRAELHRAGLRSTPSRLAVLSALRHSTSPLSHGELVDALSGRGFDRATLYRNLIDLTEAGLLRRIDVGDHTWRFEPGSAAGETERVAAREPGHPHFVCTDCGALTCLPDVDVRISPRAGSPRPPIADVSQVLLQGRCSAC